MAESIKRGQVYVHCRPIFSGVNAQIRKKKKIKELVERNTASLQPLLGDIGKDQAVEILRSLLERRIFASEARAKAEFPDLFRPSSLRDIQRQAFEDDAARSTEEVLDSIASCHGEGLESDSDEHGEPVKEHGEPVKLANVGKKVESPAQLETETGLSRHNLPSLYPSYLPYQTQHLILTTVQQVLEECCFDFATVAMPSVLQEKKWECPMAAELNRWTNLFRKSKTPVFGSNNSQDFASAEVHETLTAVSHLRHTAVHRLPTTARAISQLLDAAVTLAETLQDNLRAAQLDELRFDINIQIKAMELSKNVLEDTVSGELQKIQQKREELDRMETALIRRMLDDDTNNKALIGRLLESSVRRIFKGKKQSEVDEEEKNGDKRENGREGGEEDGKTSEHEANDEDYSSGYETSAEEKLGDAD